jgi:hypothetical protein
LMLLGVIESNCVTQESRIRGWGLFLAVGIAEFQVAKNRPEC